MTEIIILSIVNILFSLTAYRYYSNARDMYRRIFNEPFERIVIKETIKKPLVVQDQFNYSIYHFNVIGSTYHNHVMRDSYHRMIEKIAETGSIEVREEPVDQLNKKITLKLTIIQ